MKTVKLIVGACVLACGVHVGATAVLPSCGADLVLTPEGNSWMFSGERAQHTTLVTPPLPSACAAVRIELVTRNGRAATVGEAAVYRVDVAALDAERVSNGKGTVGKPVRSAVPQTEKTLHSTVVEGCLRVPEGASSLSLRMRREPSDPADTYAADEELVQVRVTPLASPPPATIVENQPGYNAWPMPQMLGETFICSYTRGLTHSIGGGARGAFARVSSDGGKTWSQEHVIANDPRMGEVVMGTGLDGLGGALFWVRYTGARPRCEIFRSTDGVAFERLSEVKLDPFPMQVMNIFPTSKGLMALWFATNYKEGTEQTWGTLTSADHGRTWTQRVVERVQARAELPTEPSVVVLGGGRLLAIARTEDGGDSTASQFQLTSIDDGVTWTKRRTNIRDVNISTPALVYDPKTDLVTNYYYERGRGVLKRRIAKAAEIFDHPLDWPDPEGVGFAREDRPWDAGNVKAVVLGDRHGLAYYAGDRTNTTVYVQTVQAPLSMEQKGR